MNQKLHVLLAAALAASAFSASAAPDFDPATRLQLAQAAAQQARLHDVGLDFRDVYGVIHAESSWKARDGMGKNGVVSRGLGQFEPATARAVGLRDPNNAVDAVNAAARLLREAAAWSAQRVARLGLSPEQRASKLREGVSIYYNLSTHARNTWNGLNTDRLPVETQRHIRNVRAGARQAEQLSAKLGGPSLPPLPALPALAPQVVAQAKALPAPVKVATLGTIEWSGQGGRRSYTVLSDGTVKPQVAGNGGIQFNRRG